MIAVTGATGQLGRLVVTGLLDAGVPGTEITALVRDETRAADLAARGVRVAVADYTDPAGLRAALSGVDRLLLVSGSEVGQRVVQHTNVVEAAVAAGVGLLVYTSAPKADATTLVLAPEHAATEQAITAAGIPAVVLRNNWYWENYDAQVQQAASTGRLAGSSGAGRAWPASRADFAAAAVAVLTAEQPATGVHELGGDQAFVIADLAAEVGRQTGTEVTYQDLTADDHRSALLEAGLDEGTAGFVTALDGNIAAGELDAGQGGISSLTGRPTRSLGEYVAQVLGR